MKKVYALVACMLIASVCFAQNFAAKKAYPFQDKKMVAPSLKHHSNVKGEETFVFYPNYFYAYWGQEVDLASYLLQYDTLGLSTPTEGTPWHPNVHGWCQTFDFLGFEDEYGLHNFYEDASEEGDYSLLHTSSMNLDSITILGGYFRGANVPAEMKDTLIVGVLTNLGEEEFMGLVLGGNIDFMKFYAIEYDVNTGVQTNAAVFKFPIGEENVSEEDEDSYYTADLNFPIGLTGIQGKVWNVAYTFKRGYDIGVNDDIYSDDNTYFTAWLGTDPREGYSPFNQAGDPVVFEDHLMNFNMGGCVDDDLRYDRTDHDSWAYGIYTPNPFWSEFHYPYIGLTVSSDDWAYVSVEDMEKENLTVYPNPAHNYFKVELAGDSKATVQLFNLVGQQVYSETASNLVTVNTSNLKAGIYMLKVSQNGKVYTSKVVVK